MRARKLFLFILFGCIGLSSVAAVDGQKSKKNVSFLEKQKKIFTGHVFWKIAVLSSTIAALGYLISQRETLDNIAGDETKKFVRDTLRQAGYSEDQIKKVNIYSGSPFCSMRNSIFVPFNDEQLLRAQRYYETGKDLEGEKLARAYVRKMKESRVFDELDEDDILNVLQFEGKAITADSIPFWKGAIIHEMGHIVHSHVKKTSFFLGTVGSFIAAYGVAAMHERKMHEHKKMQKCFNTLGRNYAQFVAAVTILSAVMFFSGRMRRPHESQADDEVIKRISDPEVLRASAQMFKSAGKLVHSKSWWKRACIKTLLFFDPHPRGDERALKFKRAYRKIEAQEELELA